jgi:arylsulfatase A-like enzyme
MNRPNILFVLSDQHRGDWLAGSPRALRTPNIDRLAATGVRFPAAICASPLCAPSRAALATGLNYARTPVLANDRDLDADAPTFYRALREAGYAVLTCGKLDLFKEARSWGSDGQHRQPDGSTLLDRVGFTGGVDSGGKHDSVRALREGRPEPFADFIRAHGLAGLHSDDYDRRPTPNFENCDVTPLPDIAYGDNWVGAGALRQIERGMASGKPWFLQVNFLGPHEPMDVTATMADRWAEADLPLPDAFGSFDAGKHLAIRRRYAAMIENIDRWIGTFLAVLARNGALETTIVVYASDHGEMLGDRGLWAKLYPFQPSLGVPFVASGPGIEKGRVRAEPISLVDCGATFAELAGTRFEAGEDGVSFAGMLAGGAAADPIRTAGFGSWRAATDGRHKLIAGYAPERIGKPRLAHPFDPASLADEGTLLLYDLEADPGETRNIFAQSRDRAAPLLARLAAVTRKEIGASPRKDQHGRE